jgi:hypothetical protein
MKNKNIATILFIIVIIISIKIYSLDILSLFSKNYDTVKIKADEIVSKSDFIKIIKIEQKLSHFWLKTDTNNINIEFDDILSGWPGKDGIPSINKPKFVNVEKALEKLKFLKLKSNWISVEINDEAKFYPYEILVWHEIVNDSIWEKNISVTFCPLCWSAIVYDRNINWKKLEFWVSGLLYESNLLMYDKKTESLWSQSLWKSVAGKFAWIELDLIKSNLMTFDEFKKKYPNWKILSDDTWFLRDYWNIPYWDYNNNDDIYFPIKNEDLRFFKKEIFYIVNYNWKSLAFLLKDLRKKWSWKLKVWENIFEATFKGWIVNIKLKDEVLKWYYEMWFSWINHNVWNKNVWFIK